VDNGDVASALSRSAKGSVAKDGPKDRTAKDRAMQSLTRVRLIFIRDQTNVWLRFGHAVKERIVDSQRRDAYFTPHAVLGCITWRGTPHGTTLWRAEVLRAVAIGERASQISNVDPGAEILLRASGPSKVHVLLALFDRIEAAGVQLNAVSQDYWRCAHNRLAANQDIDALTADAHRAFQARRKWLP